MESRKRTIVKSISYRIFGGLVTLGVAFIATGQVSSAAAIGIADALIKVGLFYSHERLWLRIGFGRSEGPEYHI